MATMKEISEQAGVSIATVSKVLNGKGRVNAETTQRVLSIARELNYRPNLNARSLKSGRSRTIGVITEDLTVFNTPDIVDGIAAACEQNGYHYILGNLRFDKRYKNGEKDIKECNELVRGMVDDMLAKQVDGIVYVACHSHSVISLSEHTDVKVSCAYCFSADPDVPSVRYDDEKAAMEATELLLNQGHRKIGIITGPMNSMHSSSRTRGHQAALFKYGVPYDPALTVVGDWGRDSGYAHAGELISRGVTAIFAQNDLMATGVIDYCNQNGIEVGKDLALVGFDNREIATVSRPALTTVALPLLEIGCRAAQMLMDMLEGKELPEEKNILMECSIIERGSTGGDVHYK